MRLGLTLLALGWVLALGGGWTAHLVQSSGGTEVRDVRFPAGDGAQLSGLLYVPAEASAERPAPAVLLSHGYINTREMQSAFAIELARRGFVVLAMDMSGHGYSQGTVGANAFGGPAAFAYLSGLPMVDRANIGMAGHSLGGAPILFAAKANPDGYRSMVLVGSTPGIFGAPDGEGRAFPRNLAVVFGQYDEFPDLMWQVPKGGDIVNASRLKSLFATDAPVEPGRIYGDIAAGDARWLQVPPITHPWEHFSGSGVGATVDWLQQTLEGEARPLPADNQIWFWKELGTGAGLVGAALLMLGTFQALSALARLPAAQPRGETRDRRWWIVFSLTAAVPALTYFPFMALGQLFAAGPLFPQQVNNQLLAWALLNGLITLVLALIVRGPAPRFQHRWLVSPLIAVASVGMAYGAVVVCDALFTTDFRFWVLALKPLDSRQLAYALAYAGPWILFFLVSHRAVAARVSLKSQGAGAEMAAWALAMSLGFVALLALEYGALFLTGRLLTPAEPLNTIIAIQFAPLLALIGLIGAFAYRRSNSYVPGAVICGLFITWYIVGGTATHWAG
ncbi:MAG: alpha/beta fold hydrolase [Phenylobacterium sp.]|uniref:alpha/beta hydrolase n=1 Tax=Phenylobacterium sp. TaxID=1871053 RepID=UPI00271E976A|nr:alpha/beta fold hydrolase [Phenylobacterium sp.]MDO8902211.1 alpha/beta fold hydrolase [Phenylobacterium sp.]